MPDLRYERALLNGSRHGYLFNAVAKVEIPGFYWFSGVAHNRRHNPYFQMLVSLVSIGDLGSDDDAAYAEVQAQLEKRREALQMEEEAAVHNAGEDGDEDMDAKEVGWTLNSNERTEPGVGTIATQNVESTAKT